MKNNNIAFVFPGQGSQSVGMMLDFYENYQVVRDTYSQANDILAMDLWKVTSEGPVEQLNQTVNTQPAMLVAGIASYRAFKSEFDIEPAYFAGHSLGEYTALVASGQIGFEEAVLLAKKRAESMQNAVPEGTGAMAAILALDVDKINEICLDVSSAGNEAWAANYNAPGQVVIAGNRPAVEIACEKMKSAGAKRALVLPVSVPSHCPLMQPAADMMKKEFTMIDWKNSISPVVHNADVSVHTEANKIVTALSEQLIKPVRWIETIEFLHSSKIDTIVEFGPGKVLSGLNKRIQKEMLSCSVFDSESLNKTIEFLK